MKQKFQILSTGHFVDPEQVAIGENITRFDGNKYTDSYLDEMARSLATQGQLSEILCSKVEWDTDSQLRLESGYGRLAAARYGIRAGILPRDWQIRYSVVFGNDIGVMLASVAENVRRRDMSPMDKAHAGKTLVDAGLSLKDAANYLNIGEPGKGGTQLRHLMRFLNLPEELKQDIHHGKISVEVGSMFVALEVPEKQLLDIHARASELAAEKKETRITRPILKAAIRAVSTETPVNVAGRGNGEAAGRRVHGNTLVDLGIAVRDSGVFAGYLEKFLAGETPKEQFIELIREFKRPSPGIEPVTA